MSPHALHRRPTRIDIKVNHVHDQVAELRARRDAAVERARAILAAAWEITVEVWVTTVWIAKGVVSFFAVNLLAQIMMVLVLVAFLVPVVLSMALLALAARDVKPPPTPAEQVRLNRLHCFEGCAVVPEVEPPIRDNQSRVGIEQ